MSGVLCRSRSFQERFPSLCRLVSITRLRIRRSDEIPINLGELITDAANLPPPRQQVSSDSGRAITVSEAASLRQTEPH